MCWNPSCSPGSCCSSTPPCEKPWLSEGHWLCPRSFPQLSQHWAQISLHFWQEERGTVLASKNRQGEHHFPWANSPKAESCASSFTQSALHCLVLSVCYLIGSHTCFPLSFFDTFFNFRGSIFDCSYELYSFQEEQQVQDLVGFQEVTAPYFPLSEELSGALEGAVHLLTEGRGEKEVPPASRKRDLLKRINKKVPEVSRVRPLSQICS